MYKVFSRTWCIRRGSYYWRWEGEYRSLLKAKKVMYKFPISRIVKVKGFGWKGF